MKTFLPTARLMPALLFLSILTSFKSFSQSGLELIFKNPVLKSGIANSQGAVYRFSNITTGVDAELKLKKFSRLDIVMQDVDLASLGWDKALQPQFGLPGLVLPYQNWYIDFELTFFKGGSNTTQKLDTVNLTALDVDGDGNSISEYCTFENPNSIAYSTLSYLTSQTTGLLGQVFSCSECGVSSPLVACSHCSGTGITNSGSGTGNECPDCDGSGLLLAQCHHAFDGVNGSTINGPVNNFLNIDTAATQVMAIYQFLNKDRIKFRYGAHSAAAASNGSGIRLNSTWFRQFSLTPMVTLPVKLVNFNAVLNKTRVDLSWVTSNEKNVSHFEVEKSTDGLTYSQAGLVFAYGNTSDEKTYMFPDNIASSPSHIHYYRLRTVDVDGRTSYSPVRIIRTSKSGEITALLVYPNPINTEITVTLPSTWQGKDVTIEVYTQTAQVIKSMRVAKASQTESFTVGELAKGLYFVKATCGNESAQQKVIKQ